MTKVFIDGKEGTTGLKIFERFANRKDIEILQIEDKDRKNEVIRKKFINASDITFLCLPDSASIDAMKLVENENVKIIDSSTAHRTANGWAYGFAELDEHFRKGIENGKLIANPGCHASGFNAIVYPLRKRNILKSDHPIVCHSVTGFSGGGKKMIAEYQNSERSCLLDAPRQYALNQTHKHQKEMQFVCGLTHTPIFNPIVGDFERGMEVSVPLFSHMIGGMTASDVRNELMEQYQFQKMVSVASETENEELNGFLASNMLAEKNTMKIYVFGDEQRIQVSAVFDNLGKGASGSAIQNMNIMLGIDESLGLLGE